MFIAMVEAALDASMKYPRRATYRIVTLVLLASLSVGGTTLLMLVILAVANDAALLC